MATNSGIQWTDATWNPTSGCTHVSAGCDLCYSVKMTYRLENMGQEKYAGLTVLNGKGDRHFNGVVRCHDDTLSIPLHWKKPRRIFVNSMSDLFHRDVPFEFIDKVFAVIALCPQHTFQVLTKRPERMAEYLLDHATRHRWGVAARAFSGKANIMPVNGDDVGCDPDVCNCQYPMPNVWLGTSVENQAAADERIPHLLRCPAAVRFLSCEPLLGPLSLRNVGGADTPEAKARARRKSELRPISDFIPGTIGYGPDLLNGIRWTIIGGESGSGARPYSLEWASDIIAQCRTAGVPVFHKQCGSFPVTTNYNLHDFPDGTEHVAWGDYAAGARLKFKDSKGGDMAEWPEDLRVREFPKVPDAN